MNTIEGVRGARLESQEAQAYDAIVIVSFGGPERMEDVMPFLRNVTRGRDIPRERLEDVAHHYRRFGGVSPINGQNRALIAALKKELAAHGPALGVYFGNRNWHPLLSDTLRRMRDDGVRRALAFVTSAFSSYSGCRQYREDIARARAAVGPDAPQVHKLRVFYNHPGFVGANVENLRAALTCLPAVRRARAHVAFTAHSIPVAMARTCDYEAQLREASRLVAWGAGQSQWSLVFQSRSGSPEVPWLEPDILDHIEECARRGIRDLVIVPIGFISDHMEVMYDLDIEAAEKGREVGVAIRRVPAVGTSPAFVRMIRELILERMTDRPERRSLGWHGPGHDVCPPNCCALVGTTYGD